VYAALDFVSSQVNEMPGTYLYHDHSSQNRGDGLQGPLIVQQRPGTPALNAADGDETLFLADWWHFAGDAMAMRLNRSAGHGKKYNSSMLSNFNMWSQLAWL
jgi:FtsP/CotA-like multicopper oxidase with cupredoxin domain